MIAWLKAASEIPDADLSILSALTSRATHVPGHGCHATFELPNESVWLQALVVVSVGKLTLELPHQPCWTQLGGLLREPCCQRQAFVMMPLERLGMHLLTRCSTVFRKHAHRCSQCQTQRNI